MTEITEADDEEQSIVREYPVEEPYAIDVDFGPTKAPMDPDDDAASKCVVDNPFTKSDCEGDPVVWVGSSGFCKEHFLAEWSLDYYDVESIEELPDEWEYPNELSCIVCDGTWDPEQDDGQYTDCPQCR